MLSLAVILVDGRLRALDDFRSALTSFLTPFKEVVQLPGLFIENSAGYFISKKNLNEEIQRLTKENQLLQLDAARMEEMRQENEKPAPPCFRFSRNYRPCRYHGSYRTSRRSIFPTYSNCCRCT